MRIIRTTAPEQITDIRITWILQNCKLVNPDYVMLPGETDITTITDLFTLKDYLIIDYLQMRNGFKLCVTDFDNLPANEKDLACLYCAVDSSTIGAYYISKGQTPQQATESYIDNRVNDIRTAALCYYNRITAVNFTKTIMVSIGQAQGEVFTKDVRTLTDDLRNAGILGTQNGNSVSGIIDYLNGTGDYIGTGFQLFDFTSFGTTYTETKDKLLNIILNGTI